MVAFLAFSYYKFLLLHTKFLLTVIISICETFRQLSMAHDNANNVAAHHYVILNGLPSNSILTVITKWIRRQWGIYLWILLLLSNAVLLLPRIFLLTAGIDCCCRCFCTNLSLALYRPLMTVNLLFSVLQPWIHL